MAQTGFTPISNYYSATATNVPTAGNLVAGELAINTADGKLFYKDSSGVVQTMASKATTAGTYSSITTSNLTIGTTQLGAGDASLMKNRIINGAMVIDQRNAGASVTITTDGTYTLDRWTAGVSQASKISIQQNAGSITPPTGFSNYLGVTSLAATSVGSGDYFQINQRIEGFNTADLGWGTASAKTVTLSFQVYSSLTGTFGGSITNGAFSYSYPFSYSIPVANTWTTISITIAGPTAGTWIGATNGIGMRIYFGLGVGSTYNGAAGSWSANGYVSATGATSVVGTNGATFYITGVQLEVGSSATGFEYVNYQTSLSNCMRYFQVVADSSGVVSGQIAAGMCYAGTEFIYPIRLTQTMRSAPTMTLSGTLRYFLLSSSATTTSITFSNSTTNATRGIISAVGTAGAGSFLQTEGSSGTDKITASAEL
jgi:hypothetical protein